MSHRITLPKNEKALVDALNLAKASAWGRRNAFYLLSQVAYYYLQGIRKFRLSTYEENRLQIGYETDLGELKFRNEDLRDKYRTELGRYMRMDIAPDVSKVGWGIDSLRKSSIGQVALQHETRHIDFDDLKSDIFQPFLTYGTIGLHHEMERDAEGKTIHMISFVPAWELLPIPAVPTYPGEVKGHMRYRMVPLNWLKKKKEMYPNMTIPAGEDGRKKMQAVEVPAGQPVRGGDSFEEGLPVQYAMSDQSRGSGGSGTADTKKSKEWYVPLTETYLEGPNRTLARYIIKVGDHIAYDMDYYESEKKIVPMCLAVAQHTPDCGYYTYGFVGSLISMNVQVEKMLQRLFKNVQDIDTYGALFWPLSAGAGKKEFAKRDGGPKIITYEVDYSTGGKAQPFVVSPFNSGDTPGKLVAMGNQIQDKLAGQGPQFQGGAPGRVDSAAGLGFLFEVQNIALAAPSHQIANAMSQMYKSILFHAKEQYQPGDRLSLTNITDDIAGVKIGNDGKIGVADNPLPDYWEVNIDIKDRQPKSPEQQKEELVGMLQMQIIDPLQFRIENQRHNLGFITGNRAEWEQYRKAVFANIMLFGDGTTPGDMIFNPIYDDPQIFLMAMTDFTSRLEFQMADKAVREAFETMREQIEAKLAGYPNGMPPMEMMGMEGGGMGGPGGPGGGMMNPNPQAGPQAPQMLPGPLAGGPGGTGMM